MSLEAEQYLIGAMFLNPDITEQVASIVNPDDFSDSVCRDLFWLVMAVRGKGLSVDVVAVSNVRERLSNGEPTIAMAAELYRNAPGWQNWEHFSGVVRDASIRRAYRKALETLLSDSDAADVVAAISTAQSRLAALVDGSRAVDVRPVVTYLKEVTEDIEERMEAGGQVKGLLTGYADLDGILQGMRGGHMVVVAGRPGTGKTTLAMNIVENVASTGIGSLVFSLEMTGRELARRMLASVGKIPLGVIDTGKIENHGAHLTTGITKIKDLPVYVCDRGGLGIAQIRAIASFQKRVNKIGLVVIDYIGLIRTPNQRNANRAQELGEISRQCKEMAKELDVPVIVLAQLNREIDKVDRDPRLSDLRDSGEIEQDADVVAFVTRTQDDGISKIVVAKHRHARPGDCRMVHRGDLSRFDPLMAGYVEPVKKRGLEAF